jgi:hypothetical protein
MESDEKSLEGETFSADANPSRTSSPGPTAKQREWTEKTDKILEACKWRDLEAIRNYATSEDGLISDEVRRLACSCFQSRHNATFYETNGR